MYRTVNGAPQDVAVTMPKGPGVWDRITSHFVDCIVDGAACGAPLRHGLEVQRMMEAVLRSAASGREVALA